MLLAGDKATNRFLAYSPISGCPNILGHPKNSLVHV